MTSRGAVSTLHDMPIPAENARQFRQEKSNYEQGRKNHRCHQRARGRLPKPIQIRIPWATKTANPSTITVVGARPCNPSETTPRHAATTAIWRALTSPLRNAMRFLKSAMTYTHGDRNARAGEIRHVVRDLRYFDFPNELRLTTAHFAALFMVRKPLAPDNFAH